MRQVFLSLIFLIFLFSGCNLRERELALDKRSAELDQREQELSLKERKLQLLEDELVKKQQQLDSTSVIDSTAVYDPDLVGTWAVRMVCTETTCTGSAVGDIRNETWILSYQNKNIIVKAMSGDQLVRSYTGSYNGNSIELKEEVENTASHASSRIIVRLRKIDRNTLEGQREIIREGNCKIVYSVHMTRQQNPK